MPVCPTCHTEPSYQVVLRDRYVRQNIDCIDPYLLGQPNQARRIRNIDGVLQRYIDLGVTLWGYLALLLRIIFLAGNCTAIFYAFITYKSSRISEWEFEIPTRVVVWVEFIVICCFMLWTIWRFLLVLGAALKELHSRTDNLYKHNLELCSAVRDWYNALMNLDFSLLLMLRYVSPPAVVAALGAARRRVYGKYGTRAHRDQCCMDLCCCCCFYGRLIFCTLFQGAVVLLLAAVALLAVFIKVLQLRFLGTVDIRDWSIAELLLFGQFVINMAWLDTRQRDRRRAKLELLYQGADSEETGEERTAVKLVESLALLVLRYHYSLFTALVIHHSITSEDISFLYVEDNTERDKPRTRVKHEYHTKSTCGAAEAPLPKVARSSEWARHTAGMYPEAPSYGISGGQVVVEMSPRQQHKQQPRKEVTPAPAAIATGSSGSSSSGGGGGGVPHEGGGGGPSAPPLAAPLERFPYDFYTNGHAVGAQVRRSTQAPELKDKYEQSLWSPPVGHP